MLDRAAREHKGRIVAALAARFRDLDIAEEAFAEACARAVTAWAAALDMLRRHAIRAGAALPPPEPEPTAEELLMADSAIIPDERLRLIFVCCHPAIHPEARAALTLKLVCGLTTLEIAHAFLTSETTLAQRLVRAKRKIADARISFEVPGPQAWPERIDAVLSTIEIAYARAHADAAGDGRHAGYAAEMLRVTATLAALVPNDADVLALAATIRFAEARRPARTDADGVMVPLDEQDPKQWDASLIGEARPFLAHALARDATRPRVLAALVHAEWCARKSLEDSPPWPAILTIYDALVAVRDDPVTRLNRAVAVAQVRGATAALDEVDALALPGLIDFLPYHAVRADLLARLGQRDAARTAYDAALRLEPEPAERRWLERKRDCC